MAFSFLVLLVASEPAFASRTPESRAAAERWCASGGGAPDARRSRAEAACRDWLAHLWGLGPETMDVGYLWVLRKLLDRSPDAEIEAFVASWEPHFQGGGGSIVYPTAPRRWLPKDPGEGLERFHSWVAAPSGRPATRASRFIGEFTSAPAEGYVLTHQIFVLQWAKDTGLALPREVSERRPRLLDRLLEEHTGDPRAGDLDFERALLLLMYADVDVNRATRWVDRILDAWDSDEKRWTFEGRETIHFEGRRYEFRHGPDHPTAMALGSVKTYLDRFALPAPGGVPR